jgi:hypothetical protein
MGWIFQSDYFGQNFNGTKDGIGRKILVIGKGNGIETAENKVEAIDEEAF